MFDSKFSFYSIVFFSSLSQPTAAATSDSHADAEHAAFVRSLPDHLTAPSALERPIIDKMAQYVARNGLEFEVMMRKKNDERFRFLNSWHPLHSYYEHQRDALRPAQPQERPGASTAGQSTTRSENVKIIRAVGVRKQSRFDSMTPRGKRMSSLYLLI